MEDGKIKEILIEKNESFKKLYLQHQEYEEILRHILEKKGRSEEELEQEKKIKKQKLKLKDAMQKQIVDFKKRLN